VNAGGSREAFYTGIPSGAYRFRVIACNNDGVWNEKGAVFTFRQKPRFYETPWFYLALAFCFVFLGASAQRIRVFRLKAREAELVSQVEAQTAELARANAELKARSVELEEANIALVERGEQLEILNQELKRLSTLDPLTGIANRRFFTDIFDVEWRRARRTEAPLSLIMVDIDFFKPYNDRYGHQAGDDCLKKVAGLLSDALHRAGDLVSRYGGEEFVVLLPAHDLRSAVDVAHRLRARLESLGVPTEVSSVSPVLTISLGVATAHPADGGSPELLLNAADQALYAAKEEGRNRVVAAGTVEKPEPKE
jgi:diguanylate cyclase (GGDEF)-like protein